MTVTLEIDCPFDEANDSFALTARLLLPRGEIMEHAFSPWKLVSRELRIGRFRFADFRLIRLSGRQTEILVGYSPHWAPHKIRNYHKVAIQRFVARIARNLGCRPDRYQLGRLDNWINFYRLEPETTIQLER